MKKISLIFTLCAFALQAQAAVATDPVINLGTLTFTANPPSVWTFSVSNHSTGAITQSGSGATWSGASYTPFNLADMQKRNKATYVYIQLQGGSPDSYTDPNCGTIAITNMSLYTTNPSFDYLRQLQKTKRNPPTLQDFASGFYIAFTATVTPLADKGTCTITQTLPSWFSYIESSESITQVVSETFIPVNLTFSVTVITPQTALEHDSNDALNFGTFCASSSATQTFTVPPTGTPTRDPSMICPPTNDVSADRFTFRSSQATPSSVVVSPSSINLTGTSGDTLQVSSLTPSCTNNCTLVSGEATIYVGGTISVPAGSRPGEYEGDLFFICYILIFLSLADVILLYFSIRFYMKKIILLGCLLFINSLGFSGSVIEPSPTIDFGSVGYMVNTSGFNTITMPISGIATTSGSGALMGHTGGSAGSATIGNFNVPEKINGTITFQTNRTTNATTISTAGCGSVSISNFTTTDGTSTTASATSEDSVSFPVGARLQLTEFTGTEECTISGTVTGPVQFRIRGWIFTYTDWTDVPVNITVRVIPHLSLVHDQNAALNFGDICTSNVQQTITVPPNGVATAVNARCPLTATSADSFTVTGNTGQSFYVGLPASATISSGSNSLTIDNFTSSCSPSCTLSGSTHTFKVGGTLTVPREAAAGEYTGAYSVSVTYN